MQGAHTDSSLGVADRLDYLLTADVFIIIQLLISQLSALTMAFLLLIYDILYTSA